MKRAVLFLLVGSAGLLRVLQALPMRVAAWLSVAAGLAFAVEFAAYQLRWRRPRASAPSTPTPEPQECGAIHSVGPVPPLRFECYLAAGHDGDHRGYLSDANWPA